MVNRCHVCVCLLSVCVQDLYCQVNCGHFTWAAVVFIIVADPNQDHVYMYTKTQDAILESHGKNVNVRQVYDRSQRACKNVVFFIRFGGKTNSTNLQT